VEYSHLSKLCNTLLNKQRISEVITREIRKSFEVGHNKNTIYQNLWHAVKIVHSSSTLRRQRNKSEVKARRNEVETKGNSKFFKKRISMKLKKIR
jgi:hypothetical protein